MTALILYPTGGEDGVIHIVPWIHEQPHCADIGKVSQMAADTLGADYAGLEMAFTKQSRSPREYSQVEPLIRKVTELFHNDNKSEIMEILGNEYASDLLSQFKITATIRPHHKLTTLSHSEDPDPTRFMKEIFEPDFMDDGALFESIRDTVGYVGIVSHGYTMKSGCQPYETTMCSGWCNYFACVPDEHKVSYNELLGAGGSFPNGSHLEVSFMLGKITFKENLIACLSGQPQSTAVPGSEEHQALIKEESELIEELRALDVAGVTGREIDLIGKGFNPVSITYTPEAGLSPPFLLKLYASGQNSGEVFKEAIQICMRNLLHHWSHFSPTTKNDECVRALDAEFCNKVKFEQGIARWNDIKSGQLLTEAEISQFAPYLT